MNKYFIIFIIILSFMISGFFYYKYTNLKDENHKRDLIIKDVELEETKKRQGFDLRQSIIKEMLDKKIKIVEDLLNN